MHILLSASPPDIQGRHIFPTDVNGKMIEDNIFTSLKEGDKVYIDENF